METRNPSPGKTRARQIVEVWRERRYLPSPSPIHVHRVDLDKLEELIAEALDEVGEVARVGPKM